MRITATKIFKFEMAHQLDSCFTEECKRPHGHGYKLFVTIEKMQNTPILNKDGMVLDFKILKDLMKPIIEKYDHQFLTKESFGSNPTAENMLVDIRNEIYKYLVGFFDIKLTKLKLYETDSAYVELIE